MVYVTGDLHGDLAELKGRPLRKLKKNDTLIVLGDFGLLWSGDDREKKLLKKLGKKRYNILFLDGCHENFDLLREYEAVDYAGGRAVQISGRLHYLPKGEVYKIEGKTLVCFGGGESSDRDPAFEGKRWWRAELPTDVEMARCLENIQKAGGRADYILTHDAPAKLLKFMELERVETSWFQNWLDTLLETPGYKKWFFARYHRDLSLSPRAVAVYQKTWPLE